jgi:hypothetical protein
VLAVHDPDHLPPQLGLVQVVDGQEGLLWLSRLYQGCVLLKKAEIETEIDDLKESADYNT